MTRVQARAPIVEPCPLERWPEVPAVYILGKDDAAVRPDWSRQAARERFGVEAVGLEGGHALFLSCPAELADVLTSRLT